MNIVASSVNKLGASAASSVDKVGFSAFVSSGDSLFSQRCPNWTELGLELSVRVSLQQAKSAGHVHAIPYVSGVVPLAFSCVKKKEFLR